MKCQRDVETGELWLLVHPNRGGLGCWLSVNEEGRIRLINESTLMDSYRPAEVTEYLKKLGAGLQSLRGEQLLSCLTGHKTIKADPFQPHIYWLEETK